MNQSNYSTLVMNLDVYLDVLMENYRCKGEKVPESLIELHKLIGKLDFSVDVELIKEKLEKDFSLKCSLGSVVDLLKSTNISSSELDELRGSISKDWSNIVNKEKKDVNEVLEKIEKAFEKASNKVSELKRNHIRVDEKNVKGMQGVENQTIFSFEKIASNFSLYADVYTPINEYDKISRRNHELITFSEGLKRASNYIKSSMHSYISGDLNIEKIEKEFTKSEEQQIVDDYKKMVGEGKIEKIPEKPLTFFAKVGFKPLKKQLSEREIVDKLAQTNYVIDILDEAIGIIIVNKATEIFSQTLEQLKELKKKYSVISNKLNEDLKNSNYEEMKNRVENQKEIERKEELHKLKRKKCILLYDKILRTNDEEKIKKYLDEIRIVDLDKNEKEEIKNEVEHAYRIEKATKEMEVKIIREEQQQIHDYEAEVANAIRRRAVKELEMEGAFESEYYEAGLDVKDGMTASRKEELIQRKIQELKRKDDVTKQEQALQDLRDEGYIKREDATLENLKPFERDALYAQMRINARALEEQSSGRSR